MSTAAYPLSWPLGQPRATRRELSNFSAPFATARDGLRDELRLMGAVAIVLSTNVPLREDGLPYATFRNPEDPGVAVYFTWREQQYVLACDRWRYVQENLQAIRKTVEALRGIARWGAGEMMVAAFAGFKALPQQASPASGETWWAVLGFSSPAVTWDQVRQAYRELAGQAHPDTGGSHERMARLNAARTEAMYALRQ